MIAIEILRFSVPLALAALGEVVSERAGLINIGLEGIMLSSALVGYAVAASTGRPELGLLAGLIAGVVVAAFQAVLTVGFALDQVVSGVAINLLALGGTSTVYRRQFGALNPSPTLPTLGGLDIGPVLVLLFAVAVGWGLYRTKVGLQMRASGEAPRSLEAIGTSVKQIRWMAALAAGALAGLAGAYLTVGLTQTFVENATAGRGFMAIALVTFGRWKPLWVVLASVLVGGAEVLQYRLQLAGLGVPTPILLLTPYLVALIVLVIAGRGAGAPAMLGRAYENSHG